MDRLEFPGWVIEYDRPATIAAYAAAREAQPAPCDCNPCRNWRATRERLYAGESQSLLDQLGIAADLEAEVYHIGRVGEDRPGQHLYAGWYQLVGRLLSGELECSDHVNLGFFHFFFHSSPGPLMSKAFEDFKPLIQLEFNATVPWLSDITEEGIQVA